MAERIANLGYAALKVQTAVATPITPDVYVPYYKQNINTDIHMIEDNPVYGNKFKDYLLLQGQRSHTGSLTVMAEPNTAAHWMNMLLTKGTTTGAGPYTHPFTLTGDSKYYTLDISFGNYVQRFFDVCASKVSPSFDDGEMKFEVDVSACGSFYGREIATVVTTTLTLKTDYDPVPNKGLVVGDLVRIYKSSTGATLDTSILTVNVDGITVTLNASAAAFAAGDMIYLRPATPSPTVKTPFLWARTQFFFSDTAANALTASATATLQTRLDDGTEFSLLHMFDDDEGSKRSGGFDPASLIRTIGDVELKIKKYFDTVEEITYWNALTKRALVMRSYSETGYEFRLTINQIKTKTNETNSESEAPVFWEIEYGTAYDSSDAQGFDVKVINNVTSASY